jgi:hypothetical protein
MRFHDFWKGALPLNFNKLLERQMQIILLHKLEYVVSIALRIWVLGFLYCVWGPNT